MGMEITSRYPSAGVRLGALLLLLGLATGCASNRSREVDRERDIAVRETTFRVELAERLEAAGDLMGARFQWEVVAALQPDNAQVRRRMVAIDALIEERAGAFSRLADAQRERGQYKRAKRSLLRALALRPDDSRIVRQLRAIETRSMQRILAAKVERYEGLTKSPVLASARPPAELENEPEQAGDESAELESTEELVYAINEMESTLGEAGGQRALRGKLFRMKLQLIDQLFERGRYAESVEVLHSVQMLVTGMAEQEKALRDRRRTMADALYGLGMVVQSQDRQQAVRLWGLALQIDPEHRKAALRIRHIGTSGSLPE